MDMNVSLITIMISIEIFEFRAGDLGSAHRCVKLVPFEQPFFRLGCEHVTAKPNWWFQFTLCKLLHFTDIFPGTILMALNLMKNVDKRFTDFGANNSFIKVLQKDVILY